MRSAPLRLKRSVVRQNSSAGEIGNCGGRPDGGALCIAIRGARSKRVFPEEIYHVALLGTTTLGFLHDENIFVDG